MVSLNILFRLFSPITVPMRSITLYIEEQIWKTKSNISVDQLSQALELTSRMTQHMKNKNIERHRNVWKYRHQERDEIPAWISLPWTKTCPTKKSCLRSFAWVFAHSGIQDSIDNITGILYVKDLCLTLTEKNFDWVNPKRNAYFVPENKKLDDCSTNSKTWKCT